MKNKISDLRDHMFAALERLADESMTPEKLKEEISKSKAISDIGKVIVESAKTEILYAKLTGKKEQQPTKFLEEPAPVEKPDSAMQELKEKYNKVA